MLLPAPCMSCLSGDCVCRLTGDAAFVYEFVHERTESAIESAKDVSATAELFTGLSTSSTGAGAVVRGAIAGGLEQVAVVTDSASAMHVLPTVEALAKRDNAAVVHVAACSAHPTSLADHVDPLAALTLATALQRRRVTSHVPVITSGDTAAEVVAGAHLAQQLALASSTPAVHVFGAGAASFAGATPTIRGPHSAVHAATSALSGQFFHYVGHHEATEVFVTLATGSTPLAGAVSLLAAAGHRVGLVRIRVLRPWSSKDLLAALPASASSLLVVLPTDSATAAISLARSTGPASSGDAADLDVASGLADSVFASSFSEDGASGSDSGRVAGTPLRPGSTAAAVGEIMRRSRTATSLASASAASSGSLRHALGGDAPRRLGLGGAGDAASVISTASTFARAAVQAGSGGRAAGASGGASPSRRQPLRSAASSPSALLAALVDAAASARAADSGESLTTSLLLLPYTSSTRAVPGYLSTPQGLRVAIDSLASSPSRSAALWHALVDAVDVIGADASVRVAGAVPSTGRDAAVGAALCAVAGSAGADHLTATGQVLVRSITVVSDAGAIQLSTIVLLGRVASHLRGRPSHDTETVSNVAATVAVLGVASTTLLLPAAASAAAVLDCTAAPSSAHFPTPWSAANRAQASASGPAKSSHRPRSSLVVLLSRAQSAALEAASPAADHAVSAIVALAQDDIRTSAAVSIAGPVVVLTRHSTASGIISHAGEQHWVVLDGSALETAPGAIIVEHRKLAIAAAEAEAAVLTKQAEETAEAEAEAAILGSQRKEHPSSAWSSGASQEESKSQEHQPARIAALPGLGFGSITTKPYASHVHPIRAADAATSLARGLPIRQALGLASLPAVALSSSVMTTLARFAAEAETEADDASVVEGSVQETRLGVVPPAAPVRIQRDSLQTPKHVALPFMFPEAYRAATAPHPAEPEQLFQATVARKVRLTPEDYDRNVFHIEFDIPEGVHYDMGEALGVYGHNSSSDVDDFLEWYGLNGSDVVTMPSMEHMLAAGNLDLPAGYGETTTVSRAFTQIVDLFGRVTKQFLEALGDYATDADERTNIFFLTTPEGKDAFKAAVDATLTMADILRKFPSARPPVHDLLAIIPPIKPRHYSIASSQAMHPTQVHLLVVTVEWRDPAGRHRMGHCTRYMDALAAGDTVVVSIKPSVMKLPADPRSPVVMAGLGTGMAPFRAFIEERAVQKRRGNDVGPMVLYFGSRYRSQEYLYGDELEAYEREGVLTTQRLAFSRDQKQKVYIQHLMEEDGKQLCDHLHTQGGSFYLCGPTWPEGPVQDAMESAFASHAGVDGAATVQHLKESERYILEVY